MTLMHHSQPDPETVVTIVVLAAISRNAAFIRVNMPASLGKPFHPGT